MLDCYFKINGVGDSFVSRQASGLPIENKQFCILPPTFKEGTPEELITEAINKVFSNVLVNYGGGTVKFRAVLRRLLARMLYSMPWLRENCPTLVHEVPFFFGQECQNLKKFVFCGYEDDECCPNGLKPRGIPPHLIMSDKMCKAMENISREVWGLVHLVHNHFCMTNLPFVVCAWW